LEDPVCIRSQRAGCAGGGSSGATARPDDGRDLLRIERASGLGVLDGRSQATFPEGEYTVRAESFDGTILVGSATFTHDVPTPPKITSPPIADDSRAARKNPLSRDNLVVSWDRVTKTVDGGPVNITGYEVIVTKEVADDPHGFSRPTYDVHVPATVNSLNVPRKFLEADTVYELEVLALEASGNQTISVGFFKTA
jgi:hypothetical protein